MVSRKQCSAFAMYLFCYTLHVAGERCAINMCAFHSSLYIHVWEAKPFTFSNEQFRSSTSSKAFPLTLALSHQLNGPPLLTIVLSQPNVAHAIV